MIMNIFSITCSARLVNVIHDFVSFFLFLLFNFQSDFSCCIGYQAAHERPPSYSEAVPGAETGQPPGDQGPSTEVRYIYILLTVSLISNPDHDLMIKKNILDAQFTQIMLGYVNCRKVWQGSSPTEIIL